VIQYSRSWAHPRNGKVQGGLAFSSPLDFHHLDILAIAYRPLLPSPALTIPLTDCTVDGYLTIRLISEKDVNSIGPNEELDARTCSQHAW
jgi:hypothetical protein